MARASGLGRNVRACLTASVHWIVPQGKEQSKIPQVMSLWHSTAPCKNPTQFMLAVCFLRISVLNCTMQCERAQSYQLPHVYSWCPSTYALTCSWVSSFITAKLYGLLWECRHESKHAWVACTVVRTRAALGMHPVCLRRRENSLGNSLRRCILANEGK